MASPVIPLKTPIADGLVAKLRAIEEAAAAAGEELSEGELAKRLIEQINRPVRVIPSPNQQQPGREVHGEDEEGQE